MDYRRIQTGCNSIVQGFLLGDATNQSFNI